MDAQVLSIACNDFLCKEKMNGASVLYRNRRIALAPAGVCEGSGRAWSGGSPLLRPTLNRRADGTKSAHACLPAGRRPSAACNPARVGLCALGAGEHVRTRAAGRDEGQRKGRHVSERLAWRCIRMNFLSHVSEYTAHGVGSVT